VGIEAHLQSQRIRLLEELRRVPAAFELTRLAYSNTSAGARPDAAIVITKATSAESVAANGATQPPWLKPQRPSRGVSSAAATTSPSRA
jgi:hypothetical protein